MKDKELAYKNFRNMVISSLDRNDGTTYWVELDKDYENKVTWAIVVGHDCDDFVCSKVAYLPFNSSMSEYDMDWLMPMDAKGNVYDSEEMFTMVDEYCFKASFDCLLNYWEKVIKENMDYFVF